MAVTPPKDHLLRAVPGLELAPAEGESLGTLTGHFAVWDEWIEVNSVFEGHFMERFAPGSFAKTFKEGLKRMRCIFRHGLDPQIGQKVLGPIQHVLEDERGANYEVPLYDTQYNRELLPGLRDGQYGSSFEFGIVKQDYQQRPQRSDYNPQGLPERVVLEAVVTEFGPCTFPQYQTTTAGIRSVTDDIMRERLGAAPEEETKGSTFILSPSTTTATTLPAALWVPGAGGTAASAASVTPAPVPAPALRSAEDDEQRRYHRSVERLGSLPWACHPAVLATIKSIVAERAQGYKPSPEEIRERLGARRAADEPQPEGSPVAVLALHGPIVPRAGLFSEVSGATSVERFQQQFRAAMNDPAVQAVLLDIDSPGGEVSLVPELAAEIRAARGDKPIVAIANTWAASAAYWIGSQADEFYVTPSGQVGSVGVWSAHEDISAMEELMGVKTTLVSAGKYKVEGNPFEPLSEEARAEMQRGVDETYTMFLDAVAKGRGVSRAEVRQGYGQGRLVRPRDALAAGMVDGVKTYSEVLAQLTKARSKRSADEELAEGALPQPEAASEPEPSEAATRAQRSEPDPPGGTTRERESEDLAAWKARVEEEHRTLRRYANGIDREDPT